MHAAILKLTSNFLDIPNLQRFLGLLPANCKPVYKGTLTLILRFHWIWLDEVATEEEAIALLEAAADECSYQSETGIDLPQDDGVFSAFR